MIGIYPSRKVARDMLYQQPFTQRCRDRHEIVPVFDRNLLGEKLSELPIGWTYRLKPSGVVR